MTRGCTILGEFGSRVIWTLDINNSYSNVVSVPRQLYGGDRRSGHPL